MAPFNISLVLARKPSQYETVDLASSLLPPSLLRSLFIAFLLILFSGVTISQLVFPCMTIKKLEKTLEELDYTFKTAVKNELLTSLPSYYKYQIIRTVGVQRSVFV
ncbi:hypothetical protein K435DRAFT_793338 [Dendrothele bispora CBS 962.96]|uniref:Uncharacterized protein n=1 Tax=Dendrothele bispora (strain CBS 962.96) TaxID=1314807 RepID=A0A4S8MG22_DENBC|nr:hypothetical protein K435DRAFT_793338 [Dendrothele bispora CBS 962.96]